MASHGQDISHWLSVTEETLFLHDGLMRVTDLVQLPKDLNRVDESDRQIFDFDPRSNEDLCERLMSICSNSNNAYTQLLEYRLNAIEAYWQPHNLITPDTDQNDSDSSSSDDKLNPSKRKSATKVTEQTSFSSRISVLLVIPLLKSQSRVDPSLCGLTANVLLTCLRDCLPLSLSKEPGDCLNGLESLLCSWLGEETICSGVSTVTVASPASDLIPQHVQRETIASSLVALSCARGDLATFIHTIHLLQNLEDMDTLPVADVMSRLSHLKGGQGQISYLSGQKHSVCWGFDDLLSSPTDKELLEKEKDSDVITYRSIACDGMFLYTTNFLGRGLAKLGTGLHGTLRGYVYCRNADIGPGRIACDATHLIYRPAEFDKQNDAFVLILSSDTLQPIKRMQRGASHDLPDAMTTVGLTSDGEFLYHIWCTGLVSDKGSRVQNVRVDTVNLQNNEVILVKRTALEKIDDSSTKNANDNLLTRLRPSRTMIPVSPTLVAITGEATPTRKEDVTTSVGIPIKSLVRTPMYCDGTSIVMIIPSSTSLTNNTTTRSLFGSGANLASLRVLAANMCFNLSDGMFNCRNEIIEMPTCALSRGANPLSLGVCFDVHNNYLWTCSNDWVDQYHNTGSLAPHHINRRLTLSDRPHVNYTDNRLPRSAITEQLLHHVGSMCLHHLYQTTTSTPDSPIDLAYLQRVCDIMENGLTSENWQIVISCLIILQLLFKVHTFKQDCETQKKLVERTSGLVWRVMQVSSASQNGGQVQCVINEACRVISEGFTVIYPTIESRQQYVHWLVMEDDGEGASKLLDSILIKFAEELKAKMCMSHDNQHLRLSEGLTHLILRRTVKESVTLLRRMEKAGNEERQSILANIPVASPCLRYISALQNVLLREAVLCSKTNCDPLVLQGAQESILSLSSKVFAGAHEVLEVLCDVGHSIIAGDPDFVKTGLQDLERVTKATILGHLLPICLTCMTHPNLHCLNIADTLMPQLVQLVVLTSQAALLLKVQILTPENSQHDCTESDLMDLSKTVQIDRVEMEAEEKGFLSGLRIPAPWASGRTVESIHPVRDNYKFKESVHIPGARSLFLRFDQRCSSQYDYDKLILYAGPNTNSKKVAEYGGNSLGFGSRSLLGSGWPKDLIKVDGDTVTFMFEMRSGREHNTPDKAMWGFSVTVRAQESNEDADTGLPFLADLALGLSVLSCTMLQLLYQGPAKTVDETACDHILKSKLLQRCVWPTPSITTTTLTTSTPIDEDRELKILPSTTDLPRIRLPSEMVTKLRTLTNRSVPKLRPSIRDVIQFATLEESLLSAAIKHLGLSDQLAHLPDTPADLPTDQQSILCDVMDEVFRRLDALVRQLQSVCELEKRWEHTVDDLANQGQVTPPFFADYHMQESRHKDLSMLCYLKGVELDDSDMAAAVKVLTDKLKQDSACDQNQPALPKSTQLVHGLLEKLELLLHVTISPLQERTGSLKHSTSYASDFGRNVSVTVQGDADTIKSYTRSQSAPSGLDAAHDDSIIELSRHRKRKRGETTFGDTQGEVSELPPHVTLIEQLFAFIGSDPEKAISCESFLQAASMRHKRGKTRTKALVHMKELLMAASRVGGATHLVAAVTTVLQHGPRTDELTCGGVVSEVREAFSETMTSVIQLAARYPFSCCNSIGLLCVIPYTRAEERCLVRCGLVHLLDRLCSLTNHHSDTSITSDVQTTRQRVSGMAWAGFQVLANRCVSWESHDGNQTEALEHSGLARQVSMLLTNHLARATDTGSNDVTNSEALQEVLCLLNKLSRSQMGKAILSQPACLSKLLSLLLDQRPSPKLVLIIVQLCRVALPLMSIADTEHIVLPLWGEDNSDDNTPTDSPSKIVSLLLAKLGDFLTPGSHMTVSTRSSLIDQTKGKQSTGADKDKFEDLDIQDGKLSVFLHKREDQTSHEVIQLLLSCDNRPFRLGAVTNMEKVVRMDRDITKSGRAEITTEDAITALRKAAKWSQMGLVVSTGPPVTLQAEALTADKKKASAETICKERNVDLTRTDPVRPFISAHVANNMAAEVIGLLHGLLYAPESSTAQTWATSVRQVLSEALSHLPSLLTSLDTLSPFTQPTHLMYMAKQANAALAAIGGFSETVKSGASIYMKGDGLNEAKGRCGTMHGNVGSGCVMFTPSPGENSLMGKNTGWVPIARIATHKHKPSDYLLMSSAVIQTAQTLLDTKDTNISALQCPLPIRGDGNSLTNQICRVMAEIYHRSSLVLATYLENVEFTKEYMKHCSGSIDVMKSLAKDCGAGERFPVLVAQCDSLRNVYRDCAKPPPPPIKASTKYNQEMMWDSSRPHPPVRSCLFSQGLTGISFLGDASAGSGLPRGVFVYASQPVPAAAPSFYWELEMCSMGETQEEGGATVSFGFAPPAEKKDGAWTNPVGTITFLNSGKAVHYNGASLLQWRSVRLDVNITAGDVCGIGWERLDESSPKGQVYFTYNGTRLSPTINDVASAMFPVVHLQKKYVRVRANFGSRAFAYAEGQHHRDAADEHANVLRDVRETFGMLPFCPSSDSESDTPTPPHESTSTLDTVDPRGPPCKVAQAPRSLKEYDSDAFLEYKLQPSFDNFVTTGADTQLEHTFAVDDDDDDSDDDYDDMDDAVSVEDHYGLLVKAWEQKVFPVIRRRFRNEAERKDGLEQIRGALQLGMTDIARQTVEFLYEENGGMPRDLHLPTLEDIREDLDKFTIDRVRKGASVIIENCQQECPTTGATILPKFAVRAMTRTLGTTGKVLDIDVVSEHFQIQTNELVQVETYLKSEGVMVRYWYPLHILKRPCDGGSRFRGNGRTLDTCNIHIHRELLNVEARVTRMYCRTALLQLIDHCNSSAMEIDSGGAGLSSAMAASAALLQELDIENIQLLSNELLVGPELYGGVITSSLTTATTPSRTIATNSGQLSDVIYSDVDRLKQQLSIAIARAANQGEDYLTELSNQLCMCLQTSPEMFPYEEFTVTEVKMSTDVYFPGAACLLVSCKTSDKQSKKDAPYKAPWAKIFCYSGVRVKKNGKFMRQEVVRYPRDIPSHHPNDIYYPTLIPADRIHIHYGVSPRPGITITIHAIPPQFLVAIAYIETLVTERYGCGTLTCGVGQFKQPPSNEIPKLPASSSIWKLRQIEITAPIYVQLIEMMGGYLWRTSVPAWIKEYTFHLLAQTLRVLLYSDPAASAMVRSLGSHLNPSQGLLCQLHSELRKLYNEETKGWTSHTLASGTGIGIAVSDKGRFTTYFNALMEVSLAIAEVTSPLTNSNLFNLPSGSNVDTSPPPTTPLWKRKKMKTKKEKSSASRQGTSHPQESDSSLSLVSATPGTSSSSSLNVTLAGSSTSLVTACTKTSASGNKLEDLLWFHRALTMSQILRHLIFRDKQGEGVTIDAILDAAQMLITPTAHTRLLVITNIPRQLEISVVEKQIRKCCRSSGGLYREHVFIPTIEETNREEQNLTDADESTEREDQEMPKNYGYAVVELWSKTKVETARRALYKCRVFLENLNFDRDDNLSEDVLNISLVNQNLLVESQGNGALEHYLRSKLLNADGESSFKAVIVFTEIFQSCFISDQTLGLLGDQNNDSGYICLNKEQITVQSPGNMLGTFFNQVRAPKKSVLEYVNQTLRKYGFSRQINTDSVSDKGSKSKTGRKSPRSSKEKVVLELSDCGKAQSKSTDLPEKTPSKTDLSKSARAASREDRLLTLDGFLHFVLDLQAVVAASSEDRLLTLDGFLHLVLDLSKQDPRAVWRALLACGFDFSFDSTAAILSKARGLIFYDTKINLLDNVINVTAKRKSDHPAPEIDINPLKNFSANKNDPGYASLCMAFKQSHHIHSHQLCVRLASGGDPTFSLNVHLLGEAVHGFSGAFRDLLNSVVTDLHSPLLGLLTPTSSFTRPRAVLKPGPMGFIESQVLTFVGQLLGMTLRADIPFGVNLHTTFWKNLVSLPVTLCDLEQVDPLTYSYLKKLELAEGESELNELCCDVYNSFMYTTLDGYETELVPNGRNIALTWENHQQYVAAIRSLRKHELANKHRVNTVRLGLASIIPIQLLNLMTPADIEIRTCGYHTIDLDFLKMHTMYQVGLSETDPHITYFWHALESFSPDDLSRFVKFACNQERLPQSCPCKDGSPDAAHVPPYPMKIAPPDGPGNANNRLVRAETCIFMIKLPQYSNQEVTTERLMQAINCRQDPLSG